MYDYYEAVKSDVLNVIEDYAYLFENAVHDGKIDFYKAGDALSDALWVDDSVTGHGSGSYTFSKTLATKYILDNVDLLFKVTREYDNSGMWGQYGISQPDSAESADVMIRCYLLNDAIAEVLEELLKEIPAWLQEIIDASIDETAAAVVA